MNTIILRRGGGSGSGSVQTLANADYFADARLALVANNCRLPYTYGTGTSWCNNYWTKHRSGPSGYRSPKVTYVNCVRGTNAEYPGQYDWTLRAGIFCEGKFTQGKFSGNTDVNMPAALDANGNYSRATAEYPGLYIPPNTDFYTTCRTVANDYLTAQAAISGFSLANPCVITTSSTHAMLAGQEVRFSDIMTNVSGAITGATQANPCVITSAGHGLSVNDFIRFESIGGMVELNHATNGGLYYRVNAVVDANNFSIKSATSSTPTNSTGFTAYTSGGTWRKLSQLNYLVGSGTYTVANPTATTFQLSGINTTGFLAYGSGGVADRCYNVITSHGGTTVRADGLIATRNIADDCTMGVGFAYGGKTINPVITAAGVMTGVTIDPNNRGVNLVNPMNIAAYFGAAGVGAAGALIPGLTAPGGFANASGGVLNTVSASGGTGMSPNNPPLIYIGGTGTPLSGFGTTTASYGPACIMGIPDDDSVQSVLIWGDSIPAGYGSTDANGDIFGNYGCFEQALANKVGVLNWSVSGQAPGGTRVKTMALLQYLVDMGLRLDSAINTLNGNAFNSNAFSTVLVGVLNDNQGFLNEITAMLPDIRVFHSTCGPFTTSTDDWTTIANQTSNPIGYIPNANYGPGGFVQQYNTHLRNGTGIIGSAGCIEYANLISDSTDRTKFRVAGNFYLGPVTARKFTNDGIHPNVPTGIPYLVANMDMRAVIKPKSIRTLTTPDFAYAAMARGSGEHVFANTPVASAVTVTNTTANIASITLSAGNWRISGSCTYVLSAASISFSKVSISKISATHGMPEATSESLLATTTATANTSLNPPPDIIVKVPERSTGTFYLVAQSTSSAGTVTAYGSISATSLD